MSERGIESTAGSGVRPAPAALFLPAPKAALR